MPGQCALAGTGTARTCPSLHLGMGSGAAFKGPHSPVTPTCRLKQFVDLAVPDLAVQRRV